MPRGARPVAWSAAIAAGWAVLALANPETTYHFGPLLAAAAPGVVHRSEVGRRSSPRRAAALAAVGVTCAGVALAVLRAADALRGPALVGGNATGESLIAIAAGAAVGVGAALVPLGRFGSGGEAQG